jgi:hypothetical protein
MYKLTEEGSRRFLFENETEVISFLLERELLLYRHTQKKNNRIFYPSELHGQKGVGSHFCYNCSYNLLTW